MKQLTPGAVPLGITIILGILTAVGPFSLDAYLPSFPTITTELGATPQQVQLSLTACLIGLAIGQLVVGPWADRIGRRLPLMLGSGGYFLASLACAFADSIELFIVLRFVQGFAGAAGLVLARAVVQDLAAGRDAIRLYSQLAVISGVAPVIAPVLGAAALAFVSWRGVFVGLAILGALLTVLVASLLPETHARHARTTGSFLTTVQAFGLLLRDRAFAGYVLVSGLVAIILFGYISSSSFVLQNDYGADASQFALIFAANGIGLAAVGQLNARIAPRFGALAVLRVGSGIQLLGTASLAGYVLLVPDGDLLMVAILLFLAVAPLGFMFSNTMAVSMSRAGDHAGTASAVLGVTTFLFGALVAPLGGAGEPARVMVIIMLVASTSALALILILRRTVRLVEE